MTANHAASIKERLLSITRLGTNFNLVLVRYVTERFLYRLGESAERERCALKGGALLNVWLKDPYRSTQDLDLSTTGASDRESIRDLISNVCSVACVEDGVTFDLSTLVISEMSEANGYRGQRAKLTARIGTMQIVLRIDFGFGDVVSPGLVDTRYPGLVAGLPTPSIRAYPRETTIAEKFQAMVVLGRDNSRMKDFHDVWALSELFPFDGGLLIEAVTRCFERRRTDWSPEPPTPLTPSFYSDRGPQNRWAAYLRRSAFEQSPPADFERIGERMRSFLGPLRTAPMGDRNRSASWPAGGPWTAHDLTSPEVE